MKRRDKHQWMLSRINDPFFIKAKKEGYRARSAYKLIEIQEKFKIIPKSGYILDLGCAPGAWLQVLQKTSQANIFGIDLLEIQRIHNITFFQGDVFSEESCNFIKDIEFDLILSDIAPNCCGDKAHDHLQIMALAERVLELVIKHLKTGGNFCVKLFDGRDIKEYVSIAQSHFEKTKFFKPKSSARESNEFYLLCLKKHNSFPKLNID